MNNSTKSMMDEADDIVYAVKMASGTGTDMVDSVSEQLRQMLDLYNDATRADREMGTDDSAMHLAYILTSFEQCIDHLKGLPKSNRSRTAREAAKARAA